MDKYIFPAVFHTETSGYSVHFPDLPGCVTEGETLEHASTMSREALELYLYELETNNEKIPEVSGSYNLDPGDFVVMITANINLDALLSKEGIEYIISRLFDYAKQARQDAKENPQDPFYSGKELAYVEMLNVLQSELDAREQDLKILGLDKEVTDLI